MQNVHSGRQQRRGRIVLSMMRINQALMQTIKGAWLQSTPQHSHQNRLFSEMTKNEGPFQ